MKRHIEFLVVTALIPFLLMLGCGVGSQPPVSVSVSPAAVTLGAGETQQFSATVANSSNTSVTWGLSGCSAAACGTISSSGLYTAPSPIPSSATVTVTATSQAEPSASATATVTHVPLSVEVSPSQTLNLGAGTAQNFTASITKHSNHDVTWSLSGTGCTGDACGTLTNITTTSATYNAPPTVPNAATVAVSATSVADTTKSKTVSINLMPVSVSMSPGTAAYVVLAGTRNYSATLQYDPHNAGVTWALSGAGCSGNGCGTLADVTTASAVYHAPDTVPDPPRVTLSATSITDSSKSAVVTVTICATLSAVLQGKYAFLIHGWRGASGEEAMAGHLEADGTGKLTGVWDVHRGTSAELAQPITGGYDLQPDGQGTMTIQAGTATWTYHLTMDATGETARFAESTFTPNTTGAPTAPGQPPDLHGGYMAKQDPQHLALSSVEGDRVIALFGNNVAALGRFTSNAAGTLSNGVMDLTWSSGWLSFFNTTALTGAFAVPDPGTGRGTASLTVSPPSGATATYGFAYYVVSERAMLLVQTDAGSPGVSPLSGEARYQNGAGAFTNSSLNAPIIFHLTSSVDYGLDPTTGIGQMVPDGSGALSAIYDRNEAGQIALNASTTGSYSVAANGRVTLTIPGGALGLSQGSYSAERAIAYLVDQNTGYLVAEGLWAAAFGAFEPQTGGPFGGRSLAGTFLFNTDPATTLVSEYDAGSMTLGEDGTVTATVHINAGSGASTYNFTGSFTIASNGRGTMALDATPPSITPWQVVFWAISPTRGVAIVTVNPGDSTPVLFELRRPE